MNIRKLLLGGFVAFALGAVAVAQTIGVPQVSQIGPNDLFQDIVNGAPVVGNVYAPAPLLGNYATTLPGNNPENFLIGGDFGTNLFAYGATVSSITTSQTYVANRWFAWSGTSTTFAGAQETGASDIPASYEASLRLTRSGAGILQSCVAQVIETANSYALQGQTVEFDFHALAGSGFSAANSNLQVYIISGTGADEGAAKMAFGLNAQNTGTASGGWTGQVNTGAILVPITTSWTRYSVVAPVPAAATEVGVAICWKPVGASPSSDYFEFTGAQLTRNSALTTVAGSAGAALAPNDPRAKAFARRTQALETLLQQRYYWQLTEAASTDIVYGVGQAIATTEARVMIQNPVPMRVAGTPLGTLGTLSLTTSTGTAQAATALAAATGCSSATAVCYNVSVASGLTAGNATLLTGGNSTGAGVVGNNAEE